MGVTITTRERQELRITKRRTYEILQQPSGNEYAREDMMLCGKYDIRGVWRLQCSKIRKCSALDRLSRIKNNQIKLPNQLSQQNARLDETGRCLPGCCVGRSVLSTYAATYGEHSGSFEKSSYRVVSIGCVHCFRMVALGAVFNMRVSISLRF